MKFYRDARTRNNFLSAKTGSTIVVYDTETTGLNPVESEIVQLAAKRFLVTEAGWEAQEEFNWFFKPKKPIPVEVSVLNHITNEMVADCPSIEEKFDEIASALDADFWCGHNINSFDNKFMHHLYEVMEKELPDGYYKPMDTLDASVDLISREESKKYNLTAMSDLFGIKESTDGTAGFHDALYDVRQCAALAERLGNLYLYSPVIPESGFTDYSIRPQIIDIFSYDPRPRWKPGNYFVVVTDCGDALYDKYNHTWKWSDGSPIDRPASLQRVIEETYATYGLSSDHDLLFFKTEPLPDQNRQDLLCKAMEIAGYHYDEFGSTPLSLRFTTDLGPVTYFDGWTDVKTWIENVCLDDPVKEEQIHNILHPEICRDDDLEL